MCIILTDKSKQYIYLGTLKLYDMKTTYVEYTIKIPMLNVI